MEHLDTGALRRMLDEPSAFSDSQRSHAASCDACRAQSAELAAGARAVAGALHGEAAIDSTAAYDRFEDAMRRPLGRLPYRMTVGAAAAAALVLALLFTPLGGYARAFLTIFQPQQFEPVQLSRAQLQNLHLLPQANQTGTQRVLRSPQHTQYRTLQEAQRHLDFTPLVPQSLPKDLRAGRTFFVATPGEMTYTFSAAKARAFATRSHKPLPPMPPDLDGTTIRLQTADVFNAHFGAGRPAHMHSQRSMMHAGKFIDIVETRAPRVTSSGASLQTLERYILAMPNMPAQLAAQIRALGDLQNTVPVPVIVDKQTAQRVSVQGVQGLAIGDNTGLGAGVMWQKNGMMYVVGGSVSMDDVLAVANDLR